MENKTARNKSKQVWNDAHYTQVKISVDQQIAAAFKKACIDDDISMAKVISQFMSNYSQGNVKKSKTAPHMDFSTRNLRRNMVNQYIQGLERIKTAEENYMDNIPTNLQSSSAYENAEQTVSLLNDAIDILAEAFV